MKLLSNSWLASAVYLLGRNFIKSIQRPDGCFYGSWGVCFTYATWFGIEGLIEAGEPEESESVQRACQFLLSRQNPNGGWGESYLSCVNKIYPDDGTGLYGLGTIEFSFLCIQL